MAEETADGERQHQLRETYGAGPETITGIQTLYRHEDRAARWWLTSSIFWFVVVTTFGLILATELAAPETFQGVSWLVFSRVRPSHVEGVIFAWLTMMYFGAIFYFTPRLLGTKALWSERLGVATAIVYNLALLYGFIAILGGGSTGREYAEFPWIVDVFVVGMFLSNVINILMTVSIRHVRPLYVSMWWAIASPIWVGASVFIGNVMWRPGPSPLWGLAGYLDTGIHDALINWWGNHNLFGLWLTPVLIAVTYYFIPRITNTPLYSHTLSLISFWGLIFVYAAVGNHHLLQSPSPGWLKTIASINSVAILIPVFAFFTNIFLTMRGQWDRFFTSLALRFIITGWIFYLLVNLQGALQAIQPFNVYIHFTYFTIGHSHLALLGGFTILGMGVIYYMLPHIFDKPPYSRTLAEWQYWLVTIGFIAFFIAMTISAFVQGQGWLAGQPEVNILNQLHLWNIMRAVSGGMIYTAAWVQLINIALTLFRDTRAREARLTQGDALAAHPSEPSGRTAPA